MKLDIAAKQHKTPEYLALNPSGVVPTVLIDGKPMCETGAMLMRWSRGMPKTALDYPNLAKLARLLKARPSFNALCAAVDLTEWT